MRASHNPQASLVTVSEKPPLAVASIGYQVSEDFLNANLQILIGVGRYKSQSQPQSFPRNSVHKRTAG